MTKGTIRNMKNVANELAAIRRSKSDSEKSWGVFCVKKSGEPYANSSVTFRSRERAEERAERMRDWNPGSEFVVKEV